MKTQIKKIIITFLSQAQSEPTRVSFIIKNPSMKGKTVDFKSYSFAHERFGWLWIWTKWLSFTRR